MNNQIKKISDFLLIRFKVIAEHPHSHLKIGDIFTLDKVTSNGTYYHEYSKSEPVHLEDDAHLKYPAIFKKLEWWEDRDSTSPMPVRLKRLTYGQECLLVDVHFAGSQNLFWYYNENGERKLELYKNFAPVLDEN